ncbi:MAG: hypothetical protein ACHQNA_01530 [Acidimicrobiales bacterium]
MRTARGTGLGVEAHLSGPWRVTRMRLASGGWVEVAGQTAGGVDPTAMVERIWAPEVLCALAPIDEISPACDRGAGFRPGRALLDGS